MSSGNRAFAPTYDALDDGRREIVKAAAMGAMDVLRGRFIVAGPVSRSDPNMTRIVESIANLVLDATSNGAPPVEPTPTFDALNETGRDLAFVVTRAALEAYVGAGHVAPQPAESSAVALLLEGAAAFVVRAPHEVEPPTANGLTETHVRGRSRSGGMSR